MYCGFDLKFLEEGSFDSCDDSKSLYKKGLTRYKKDVLQIKTILDNFTYYSGTLNGTDIQNNWFPQIEADIFISHSHSDEKTAIILSELLWERFKLSSFIDSCVWGYSNDLLKLIDNKYCKNYQENTYNYTKRNYSTSHVHMMLSTAIMMMIDKCECIFFLDTPNSINTKDVINERTNSPWIYSEINISRLVRRRLPKRLQKLQKSLLESSRENLNIEYELNTSHFSELTDDNFFNWLYSEDDDKHSLDVLYEIVPPEKQGVIYG